MYDKPRLSIVEIRKLLDEVRNYGSSHTMYLGSHGYTLEDLYNQYLYNLDALMGIMDEVLLKKGRS